MPACRRLLLAPLVLTVAVIAVGGCTVIQTGDALTSQSLLKAAQSSDESVRIDVYWAELPTGSDGLWKSIEETRLSADLRRRLTSNGLRAGVVGGALPDELLALLDPQKTASQSDKEATEGSLEETGVSRATYTLTPGRRVDFQAGAAAPSTPILIARDGGLTGRTFNQAQPTYTLELLDSPTSTTRGSAVLRLAPELRHGEQRLRFTPDTTGVISRTTMTRDAEPFPDLAIEAALAPGETLVVTSTPDADGRLGGCFHRASEDAPLRRAMLIRVAGTPRDDAFDAVDFESEI